MKKTLRELELTIPSINLLETRSITGGYDIEAVEIFPDYGDEENSAREDDTINTPDPNEPYEREPGEDQYQENDSDNQDNENAPGDQGNIIFDNVSPADKAIIEKAIAGLPAVLQGVTVTIQIGATKDNAPGQYLNGVITLRSSGDANAAMFQELLHALQDDKLAEEGKDMNKESRSAIEFQANVLQDIYEAVANDGGFTPASFSDEYTQFISNCFPGGEYTYENFDVNNFLEHINEYYEQFAKENAGSSSGYGDDYNPDYDFNWGDWLNDLYGMNK